MANISGNQYDNDIVGTELDDYIVARYGNDSIRAGSGNDTAYGEQGEDTLYGQDGDDWIYGGEDRDLIYGGNNNDFLNGEEGDDLIFGGIGIDTIRGAGGNDLVYGGSGDDNIWGDNISYTQATIIGHATSGNDTLYGGDGNDIISGFSGHDTAYGDNGNDILVGDHSANIFDFPHTKGGGNDILNGGLGDDTIYGDHIDFIYYELYIKTIEGHDSCYGGDGNDYIFGHGGNDIIYGGEGNDLLGGGYSHKSNYFDGNDTIFGDSGNDTIIVDGGLDSVDGGNGFDTLILTGNITTFYFNLNFLDGIIEYSYTLKYTLDSNVFDLFFKNIERLYINTEIDNVVNLSYDNTAVEMLRLADEAYGPQLPLKFAPEPLAYEPGHNPAWSEDIASLAISRGWRGISAIEMGMKPADDVEGNFRFSFINGVYQALGDSTAQANALVLEGMVNGRATLAVAFRGTDQVADFTDYFNFQTHYAKFAPLVEAIKSYLGANPDRISQILVSGHSLGAAMAEYFARDMLGWDSQSGNDLKVFTAGSPGSETLAPANVVVNFINTGDVVPMLGEASTLPLNMKNALMTGVVLGLGPWLGSATAGVIANIAPKPREGSNVFIDSDVSDAWASLDEHGSHLYVSQLMKLLAFARDSASPFSSHQLALSIVNETIYTGSDIRIAIGQPARYDTNQSREDYAARYTTDFSTTIKAYAANNYVLGNNVKNDRIELDLSNLVRTSTYRIFDGGTGTDALVLPGFRSHFTYEAISGGAFRIQYGTQSVGDTHRIELLVFTDMVVDLSGRNLSVQRSTASVDFQLTAGFDYADAGDGVRNVTGSGDGDILYLGTGNKTVNTSGGDDIILVRRNAANDAVSINGGAGADVIYGGIGNETYFVDDPGDRIVLRASGGTYHVFSSVSFELPDHTHTLSLTGDATVGMGNDIANTLSGNDHNNVLDGGSGADTLRGEKGDDTYYVDNLGDRVEDLNDEGNDTVISSVTYSLADGYAENLVLLGSEDINGTGNRFSNVLTGNSGANVLSGGLGNDTYNINNTGDQVIEADGQGTDQVLASVTFTLGTGQSVEILELTGASDINASGNALNNRLVGNAGANILTGHAGNDILNGRTGADRMIGGLGNDTFYVDNLGDRVTEAANEGTDTVIASISFSVAAQAVENVTLTGSADIEAIGNSLNNILTGNEGRNSLSGRTGADTMIGGSGHDTYSVDNIGDVVTELAGQGVDTVISSISFSLAGLFVEQLTLNGSAGNNATGNQFNNIITGNSGNNLIDGGAGADRMYGALGNDTFIIDDINDKPTEKAGEGYDTLMTGITFSVAAQNIEAIILTGSGHIDMVANPLDNLITGNSGNNVINGRSGHDSIDGGAGNDTLIGSTGNDVLTGGLGADIFLFHKKPGTDTVNDFSKAQGDILNLNDITAGIASASIVTQAGSNVIIDFGGGHILTIEYAARADVLTQIVW